MSILQELHSRDISDINNCEINHNHVGRTALQQPDSKSPKESSVANGSWRYGSSIENARMFETTCATTTGINFDAAVPIESDNEASQHYPPLGVAHISSLNKIRPYHTHVPTPNADAPFQTSDSPTDVSIASTEIITSFEVLFLAAVAEHLPSLVPLLANPKERPQQRHSASSKHFADQDHKDYTFNIQPRSETSDTTINIQRQWVTGHLEAEFQHNPVPNDHRKVALSTFLGLDFPAISGWFGDRMHFERFGSESRVPSRHEIRSKSRNPLVNSPATIRRQRKKTDYNPYLRPEESQKDNPEVANHYQIIASNIDFHRPFSCTKTSCTMTFKSKSDWKRHEETHYPQSQYICLLSPECESKVFPRKDKLLDHLKRVHDQRSCTAQMRSWKRSIPAGGDTLNCPICAVQFASWQERCDHVAEMVEASRKLLQEKEEARVSADTMDFITQDFPREIFHPSQRQPKTVSLQEFGNALVNGKLPMLPVVGQSMGYDGDDGMCKTGDFMQGWTTQGVLQSVPRLNLF